MQRPELTAGKPLYVYLKELKEYTIKQNEGKYDLILGFINGATEKKMLSLCDFKYVDIERIDRRKFKDVLNDYRDKLEGELGVVLEDYDIDIVRVIATCVESIGYSVHRKRVVLMKRNRDSESESSEERIEKRKLFLSILNKPKVERVTRMFSTSGDEE